MRSPCETNLPQRISIVGATGSGKSYLARRLSERSGLPLYRLDDFRWDASGRELPQDEFIGVVSELAARDHWIIDGHYRIVRDIIWRRAQTVAWLDYPLSLVGYRLLHRYFGKRRRNTALTDDPSLPNEPKRNAGRYLQISWSDRLARLGRTIRERSEYQLLLQDPAYDHVEVMDLKSPHQASEWLRRIYRSPATE